MANPLALVITLHVKEERVDEFLALLEPVLDAMRHEPTFINTVLHRDGAHPNRFLLYETWADREDLVEVQMKREYRTAYVAALDEMLAETRDVRIWQPMRADFTHFEP